MGSVSRDNNVQWHLGSVFQSHVTKIVILLMTGHPFFILFCVEAKTDRRKHTDTHTHTQTYRQIDRERDRERERGGERKGESERE